MTDSLKRRLTGFKNNLDLLPEADEPPSTTLQIIRTRQQEQDWQRLLFHYLSPEEPHGLDYTLLGHILSALSNRDDLGFTFSRFDLAEVQNEQEVLIPNGRRPDAVTWASEDWFICWELKVNASEGEDQTQDYVKADEFQSIKLTKDDVPADGHHYIYIAPDDADPPDADAFVPVSWEWIASEVQSFLSKSHGEYPARTTTQLDTFIGTIRSELTMTDYQENQQEKVELYLNYYDEISEVQQVFEEKWNEFRETWGERLVEALDTAVMVNNPDTQDEKIMAKIMMKNDTEMRWMLTQNSDWGAIYPPESWRTELDKTEKDPRVYFLHRIGDRYKPVAVGDRKLKFWLQSPGVSPDDFYDNFAPIFNSDEQILDLIPSRTTRTGNKANVLEATYDINVDSHSDFFEAYIAALSRAMDEHVISNPELVNKITQIYQQTISDSYID